MKKVNFKWIRGDDISKTLIFTHPDGSLFLLEGMQVDLHIQPDDAGAEKIKISTENGGIIVSQNRLTLTLSHSLTQHLSWETAQYDLQCRYQGKVKTLVGGQIRLIHDITQLEE